jgi:hypothetical protein
MGTALGAISVISVISVNFEYPLPEASEDDKNFSIIIYYIYIIYNNTTKLLISFSTNTPIQN